MVIQDQQETAREGLISHLTQEDRYTIEHQGDKFWSQNDMSSGSAACQWCEFRLAA